MLAFAVAPLGAVITYTCLLVVDPFEGAAASLVFLGIVALVSYVAELLIAAPAFAASDRIRNGGAPVWVLGGAVVGVAFAIVADLPEVNWLRWRPFAVAAAAGAASGRYSHWQWHGGLTRRCSRRAAEAHPVDVEIMNAARG